MSFLKELFDDVRSWLGRIPKRVRVLISNSLEVTTAIRKALNSPIAVAITDIIPGEWDNTLRDAILKAIEDTMPYLLIVDTCKQHETTEAMLQCWVTELRKHPKHVQDALLIKLAALLTAIQDNKQLRQNLYDTYTQMQVSGNK